jgi:hypothetical protein
MPPKQNSFLLGAAWAAKKTFYLKKFWVGFLSIDS